MQNFADDSMKNPVRERTVGENISYGNDGIFTVVDIRTERIGGIPTEYYVLRRYGDGGASLVYVPKANAALVSTMRDLMSAPEAEAFLARVSDIPEAIVNDDPRARADEYKKLLEESRDGRVALIKAAYRRMEARKAEGKKPYLNDETASKKAEKLLCAELSAVLGRPEEEIHSEITARLFAAE